MANSQQRREILFRQQKGRCHWCGKLCKLRARQNGLTAKSNVKFTLDHVLPRGRSGSDSMDNIVGACYPCNQYRNSVERRLMFGMKPVEVVKAKYLPVGFLKFSVQKMDTQER